MNTEQNNPICTNRPSAASRRHPKGTLAFTLVEIMVAAVLFIITSLALAASLIQNDKFTNLLSYRTQALNISMGMVEQMRAISYGDLLAYCNNAFNISPTGTQTTINVNITDPWHASTNSSVPGNYLQIQLPINQFTDSSGNVHTPSPSTQNWCAANVPMDVSTQAQVMPMQWWLTIDNNVQSGSGTACDVFEITLVYQWQVPGTSAPVWQSGTIRLVIPNSVPAS
jgi:Tfp pilus assembly protein PilV